MVRCEPCCSPARTDLTCPIVLELPMPDRLCVLWCCSVVLIAGVCQALWPSLSPAADAAKPIRVGIIGLDNYHSVAFSQLFHEAKAPKQPRTEGDLAGIHVVAAFPGGSPDIAESVENL